MTSSAISRAQAAIFDLDGTLVQSESAWEEAKRGVLAAEGVTIAQADYDAFVGRGLRGFLAHVFGPGLPEDHRDALAARIGAEADVLLPQMRQPISGAASAVVELAEAGLRIAVCSSSPRRHILAALVQLNLADRISVIVSGADLPRGKPDPLPYMETLAQLGLNADQAFAVEDALPGAISAHAAGLTVIGIGGQTLSQGFAPYCRVRVPDYAAFGRLFATVRGR
ncbi:MAG: HAD family phosphatase [Paracoccaceae bacterium]|jgi:sugar-phosphatase